MKVKVSKFFVAVAAACAILFTLCVAPVEANAAVAAAPQRYRRRPPRARGWTKGEVDALIKRAENRSDDFVKLFDKALDRSNLDGGAREDRLNERARDLEKKLDELRREFDRKDNYAETRPEMTTALVIAEGINDVMSRRRMGARTEAVWNTLRVELNTLARVYGLRELRLR